MKPGNLLLCMAALAPLAGHAADSAEANPISAYTVDVTGGAVSAAGLVGLSGSSIQTIETSQDLVMALQPFTSGDSKGGFAFALTPARTPLLPMSGYTYRSSIGMRLLGNLTLSYAENGVDIGGSTYRKRGASVDTSAYLSSSDDPIVVAQDAYAGCVDAKMREIEGKIGALLAARGSMDEATFTARMNELVGAKAAQYKGCVDAALKKLTDTRWNASRFNLSYGGGTLRPRDGNASYSLGRLWTVGAQLRSGDKGALYLTARRVRHSVVTDSLAGSVAYTDSSLVAARYTYGSHGDGATRALVEVSNAKASTAGVFQGAFKTALGIDRQIGKGMWLELRVGRNHSAADGKLQTTSLMTLNIAPTSGLFGG